MGSEEEAREDVQGKVLQETLSGLSSRDGSEAAGSCCVICLSEISDACTARPCSHHNFDFLCLASWLQLKPSCPLCKAEIFEIQYDFSAEGQSWKTYKVPKIGLQPEADGANSPLAADVATRHIVIRGASRRGGGHRSRIPRTESSWSSAPSLDLRARGVLGRRRHVYRNRLYSLHVGSNSASRYRDFTPRQFQTDTILLSRARAWVRRELQVFEFLNEDSGESSSPDGRRRRQNNAEFVLEYVIAILKTVDIQGSNGHAENLLSDFLGREHSSIFLHELRNFLRSPYSLEAWDRHVQYDELRESPRPQGDEEIDDVRGEVRGARADRYRPRPLERRSRGRWSRHHAGRGVTRGTDSWRPG